MEVELDFWKLTSFLQDLLVSFSSSSFPFTLKGHLMKRHPWGYNDMQLLAVACSDILFLTETPTSLVLKGFVQVCSVAQPRKTASKGHAMEPPGWRCPGSLGRNRVSLSRNMATHGKCHVERFIQHQAAPHTPVFEPCPGSC